jgi:hypothetical protein
LLPFAFGPLGNSGLVDRAVCVASVVFPTRVNAAQALQLARLERGILGRQEMPTHRVKLLKREEVAEGTMSFYFEKQIFNSSLASISTVR